MPDQQPEARNWGRYAELGQVGMEMVSPIVVGILLDRYLGWTPWLTVVGAVVGFSGGMLHLLALLNRLGRRGDDNGSRREAP
jgi:F0F1-type ATP synthase assembly protein I